MISIERRDTSGLIIEGTSITVCAVTHAATCFIAISSQLNRIVYTVLLIDAGVPLNFLLNTREHTHRPSRSLRSYRDKLARAVKKEVRVQSSCAIVLTSVFIVSVG